MDRIRQDPNLEVCPDYASDAFAQTRALLENDQVNQEQAVQMLRNIWEANNNAAKARWQVQREEDRRRQEDHRLRNEEEQADRERLQIEEAEAALKEDRKKNKFKYTPIIEDLAVPNEPTVIPSSYATRKLDKGEYVELWYFTNAGLEEAKTKSTIEDDAMIMSTLPDGSTAWVAAASSRNAKVVIEDRDLSFEDFCQACPRFITAMETAGWPAERIKMMALFWRNLQIHEYRSETDPVSQKTLLVYQAEQRKRWHLAAKSTAGVYNLSLINEVLLERTKTKVYWDDRKIKDNERDYKVSFRSNTEPQHLFLINLDTLQIIFRRLLC
ncbi:hypothetical protein P692DRAFT_20752114 [Suillus brevipes Sb2]|nr:hypothetical protein P692DRAFT_20752114 [Suillus brevipes Sb2]